MENKIPTKKRQVAEKIRNNKKMRKPFQKIKED